jgi:hypothetical protein
MVSPSRITSSQTDCREEEKENHEHMEKEKEKHNKEEVVVTLRIGAVGRVLRQPRDVFLQQELVSGDPLGEGHGQGGGWLRRVGRVGIRRVGRMGIRRVGRMGMMV